MFTRSLECVSRVLPHEKDTELLFNGANTLTLHCLCESFTHYHTGRASPSKMWHYGVSRVRGSASGKSVIADPEYPKEQAVPGKVNSGTRNPDRLSKMVSSCCSSRCVGEFFQKDPPIAVMRANKGTMLLLLLIC